MNTKKIIVYPANKWARELLTLSRADSIDYFLDDDIERQKEGFHVANGIKEVYPTSYIMNENKGDVIVIVSDTSKYHECKRRLEEFGLIENRDFFNGWKLDINFYRLFEEHRDWQSFENDKQIDFSAYEERTKIMSTLIPMDIGSIMDIGCADSKLKKYIPVDVEYYGLDIIPRDKETIVCDVNNDPLPPIQVDVYFMGGLLPYVTDVDGLFSQMRNAKYLIFSAEAYDLYRLDAVVGKAFGFVINGREDYLTLPEIINALWNNGFALEKVIYDWKKRNVMLCRATKVL